jgi:leader peptidase (prepilin peptidase)/N-methyltransferase
MFPQIAAGTVFLYCAVIIAADDYTFRIVPDRILAILFTTGALYGLLAKDNFGEDLQDTISGLAFRSAIPGLSALLLALAYRFVRGREGLGLGDVKLIAAAGIWLPVLGSFYAIALASIVALAGTVALALWRGRAATLLDSLPLAVFLAPAFWLLWLLEEAGVFPALN